MPTQSTTPGRDFNQVCGNLYRSDAERQKTMQVGDFIMVPEGQFKSWQNPVPLAELGGDEVRVEVAEILEDAEGTKTDEIVVISDGVRATVHASLFYNHGAKSRPGIHIATKAPQEVEWPPRTNEKDLTKLIPNLEQLQQAFEAAMTSAPTEEAGKKSHAVINYVNAIVDVLIRHEDTATVLEAAATQGIYSNINMHMQYRIVLLMITGERLIARIQQDIEGPQTD